MKDMQEVQDLAKAEARRRHFAFEEPLGGWASSRRSIDEVNQKIHKIRIGESSIISGGN